MDKFEELLKALEESAQKAAERREPYIKALVDRLNISEEKASSLVFDANEIAYTPMKAHKLFQVDDLDKEDFPSL